MSEVDYEQWHKECRDFFLYFKGYVRGDSAPKRELINLFDKLENIVFGETKTQSWAI